MSEADEARFLALSDDASRAWQQGRLAEAEGLLRAALELARATALPPPLLVWALYRLARFSLGQDRFAEAEPFCREARERGEAALDAGDPLLGDVLAELAHLRTFQGKDLEAEELTRRAVAIFEKAPLCPDRLPPALLALARLVGNRGQRAEAMALDHRALRWSTSWWYWAA